MSDPIRPTLRRPSQVRSAARLPRSSAEGSVEGAPARALMALAPGAPDEGGSSITFTGLDPALGSLGELISLLNQQSPGGPDGAITYELSKTWFQDPIGNIKKGVTNNGEQLALLLAQLLGSVAGQALGVPTKDPALLGSWYPITLPGSEPARPTGLYIVSYPVGKDEVFGIGVLHQWKVPSSKPLVTVEVFGMIPIMRVGSDTIGPILTEKGFPITLGAAVKGVDGAKLLDMEGIAFDGVKVSAAIDLAAPSADASVVLMNLALPDDPKPKDRSLADLASISAREIQDTAAALFVGALSQLSKDMAAKARYLLPALGLSSHVPGAKTTLPLLGWDQLFVEAAAKRDVGAPFRTWFRALASDPDLLKCWLSAIGGVMTGGGAVTGAGTRSEPLSVVLLDLTKTQPAVGKLCFTMSSVVQGDGQRHLYPGLSFGATPLGIGSSPAALAMGATLELAEFVVSDTAVAFGAPSSLEFFVGLALTNKDTTKPLASAAGYSFGALSAGVALGGGALPLPQLLLKDVATPNGNYGSVNLLNPAELASAAEQTLVPMLEAQLKKLLGIAGDAPIPFVTNAAALLGIGAPVVAGGSWPSADLPPPFTGGQLLHSLADPVTALGDYYRHVLTTKTTVQGKAAFTYLVQQFAGLLQDAALGAATVAVTGDGTRTSPWLATISLKDTTLPAALTAYQQAATRAGGPVTQLVVGLALAPSITVASTAIVPYFEFDLVGVDLPDDGSGASLAGIWAPMLSAGIRLPGGFTSPPVSGASFALGPSSLSGSFSRTDGWACSLAVADPVLVLGGQRIALGQSLDFSDLDSLRNLVVNGTTAFLDMVTGVVGVALLGTGTRAGLLIAGILGLLADLGKAPQFPSGLTWPAIPILKLSGFQNPWPDLQKQLVRDFATDDTARAVLSLVAWALDTSAATAPAIAGSRDATNPFAVPIGKAPLGLRVWYAETGSVFGLGLGRSSTATLGAVKATTDLRVGALELSLATGAVVLGNNAPALTFQTTIESATAGGSLIPGSAATGSLGKLVLGATVVLSSSGAFIFTPVVTLVNVTLPGQSKQDRITLADYQSPDFNARLGSAFQLLLNAGITEAAKAFTGSSAFETAYSILTSLGLVLRRAQASDPYGVLPAGWQALLADPLGFAKSQLAALLADTTLRATLWNFVQERLGITLPSISTNALELARVLGFLGPAELGYPIRISKFLALVQSPLTSIATSFEALVKDESLRAEIASELAGTYGPHDIGAHFSFSVTNGTRISLAIAPDKAIDIGSVFQVWGSLDLDLATPEVGTTVRVFVPTLGFGSVASLRFSPLAGGPPDIQFALAWGDGTRPAPEPLALYPFDSKKFVAQVANLAPVYVLSTLVASVLEAQVLARSPLAQKVFQGLGLATQVNGSWKMPALLGLLSDPGAWLLSEGILGKNGQFDVAGFATWLSGLPEVKASNGVGVVPQPSVGVAIVGLPYGISVSLTGKDGLATIAVGAKGVSVADGVGALDNLSIGLSLGPDYQPEFVGALAVSTAIGSSSPFGIDVGFNKTFRLAVSQKASSGALMLQLLPFQGWGSLAEALARKAPAALLNELVPRLLDALSSSGAKDFADGLRKAGGDLEVAKLVADLSNLDPFNTDTVERTALGWLVGRFSSVNAGATADAVAALLKSVLGDQISATGGLVKYAPGASLPISLYVGVDVTGSAPIAGVWVDLALPKTALFRAAVQRTGIGVPLSGPFAPVFSFGASLNVPLEGDTGPALSLAFKPGAGLVFDIDPLGTVGGAASSLSRQILPEFFPAQQGDPSDLGQRVEQWLLRVVTEVLPRYVAAIVLNQASVLGWLDAPIKDGAPTPGKILLATSLLKARTSPAGYYLNDFQALAKLTPEQFVANFLRALLGMRVKLLSFGAKKQGEIWMGPNPNDANAFGFRLLAPDFPVPLLSNLVLQIGGSDSAWIASSGGDIGKLEPGFSMYVPIVDDGKGSITPHFENMEIDLINVGLDFVGKEGSPLVDFTRFKLGAIAPRSLLQLDLNGGKPTTKFGVGVSLRDIGISLAPNALAGGAASNPVAENLLGAGTDEKEKNPPTNPAFTVSAAYSSRLWVNLSSSNGEGTQVVFPVQRSFGPLHVNSIGLGWQQPNYLLQVLFDGSVALAGFEANVAGLTVGIPVKEVTNFEAYKLDLQGLDLSFKGGAVTITGGFLKTEKPYLSYTGAVLIQAASFGLVAAGSYAMMPTGTGSDAPSLFIFGALNAPLGGVPAFFVTGVAAGFGYNRSITLPAVGDVQNFPLVSGIVNGTFSSGDGPDEGIKALANVIQPSLGQYWLAAGLKFTSFQLIDALAMIFIQFGRHFQIDLLGLAYAPLPKGMKKGTALAYIELALKATIDPDRGYISLAAQLTPNSYVIASDCKLTGGFAFALWLKQLETETGIIQAGDFVITLGGYHPAFKKPAHYPDVPRLGFNWRIDAGAGTVDVGGGVYFALVPTAVMAGGFLKVLFSAGPLRAWLDAAANFLIQWAPFYYDVEIRISVGVAFETKLAGVSITLKVELGASLHLAGPPTHGEVHVVWYIISFTIPFGPSSDTNDNLLDWSAFAETFLPRDTDEAKRPARMMAAAPMLAAAPPPAPSSQVQPLKAAVESGRVGGDNGSGAGQWLVRPVPFSVRVDTVIPTSSITASGSDVSLIGPPVGVRPMGLSKSLEAPIVIALKDANHKPVDLGARKIAFNRVTNGAPAALWSKDQLAKGSAPDSSKMIIKDALVGVVLDASQYILARTVDAFDIKNLAFDEGTPVLLPFAHPPPYGPAERFPAEQQRRAIGVMKETIMAPDVVKQRNAALATLRAAGIAAPADPSLTVMAAAAELIVQAPPVLARPGVFQAAAPSVGSPVSRTQPIRAVAFAERAAPARPPRRVASLRRYHSSQKPSPSVMRGLPNLETRTHACFVEERPSAAATSPLRSVMAAPQPTPLFSGAMTLWEVDAAASHAVDAVGAAPLRITCFDGVGEPLADVLVTPDRPLALPQGTSLVALHGVDARRPAAGWQVDSELVRVNPWYAVGEGCLVRVQNPPRSRVKRPVPARGIIDASKLLADNRVTTAGGRTRPGWIETILTGGAAAFTVAIAGLHAGTTCALRVTAAHGDKPSTIGEAPLTPQRVVERDDVTLLMYAAPPLPADAPSACLTIVVRPEDEAIRVLAVYALSAADGAEPQPASLRRSALDLAAGPSAPSIRVSIRPAAEGDRPLTSSSPKPTADTADSQIDKPRMAS